MIDSAEITEIFDGNLISIWQDNEEYFHIAFPWTSIIIPDRDTLYDILQDFKICINEIENQNGLTIGDIVGDEC